ncbi:hypothetical protein [Cetobacterium somerae]|uniref:hypothetical protein n=1 Tax=Cetobacterium somerae TaxID=188913 RepID=UPI00058DFECE|nr:hypothetical protein [Cetobacterium somerae]
MEKRKANLKPSIPSEQKKQNQQEKLLEQVEKRELNIKFINPNFVETIKEEVEKGNRIKIDLEKKEDLSFEELVNKIVPLYKELGKDKFLQVVKFINPTESVKEKILFLLKREAFREKIEK